MTCQDCGSLLPTDQTIRGEDADVRTHTCPCGSRWMSEQKITRRLISTRQAPISPPLIHTGTPQGPPRQGISPPSSGGGVGGGLSSGSDLSGSNPAPSEPPDQTQARVSKKRREVVYSPEFDAEWDQTAKTGSKEYAQAEWERRGKPKFGASWQAWAACPEWKQDWYHYPHVVKWLRDGRFAQPPVAVVKLVAPASRALADERAREDRRMDASLESLEESLPAWLRKEAK